MSELLLEFLSEEIPARMQKPAAQSLRSILLKKLQSAGYSLGADDIQTFVTPRRLAAVVPSLPGDTGSSLKIPTVADQGPADCERDREPGSGDAARAGDHLAVLSEVIEEVMFAFPWPKAMWWGWKRERDGKLLQWIRPLHNVLALLDGQPIPLRTLVGGELDLPTRQRKTFVPYTCGHRFHRCKSGKEVMGSEALTLEISSFADYRTKLEQACVVVDHQERYERILSSAQRCAEQAGLQLVEDEGLCQEITGLVEWPKASLGGFDGKLIDGGEQTLPPEVITTCMRSQQRYFATKYPAQEAAGASMAPHFVVIHQNLDPESYRRVVTGHERVLKARLSDAYFFWKQDRKKRLEHHLEALKKVTFHAKLGSLRDKADRLVKLSEKLTELITVPPAFAGGESGDRSLVGLVKRAALLCKADLASSLIVEYPSLQGIIGGHHAAMSGEDERVALAIREHYKPAGPRDSCPSAPVSVIVALADKLDTLLAGLATDGEPSGSKDPYGMRRAALGVIRLILDNALRFKLYDLIKDVAFLYPEPITTAPAGKAPTKPRSLKGPAAGQVQGFQISQAGSDSGLGQRFVSFFSKRLRGVLQERGLRPDVVGAIRQHSGDLVALTARAEALQSFLATENGKDLLVVYRRAANLTGGGQGADGGRTSLRPDMLTHQAEKALYEDLILARNLSSDLLRQERYTEAISKLSGLRLPVDEFFKQVLVNDPDHQLRANRLHLLRLLREVVARFADFSCIQPDRVSGQGTGASIRTARGSAGAR